ncbi:MAG: S8 family serine peptidase [Janthinobacterium lividum]
MKTFFRSATLLLVLLVGAATAIQAQSRRYFVYFKDKAGTPYRVGQPEAFLSARALSRRSRQGIAVRERDLPVNPTYVAQVRAVSGVGQVLYTSRWLNGAVVVADSLPMVQVQKLAAVQSIRLLSVRPPAASAPAGTVVPTPTPAAPTTPRATYGKAYAQAQQIGAVAMHNAGYRGEGMQIAIFDGGFPGAERITALQNLQQQNRVLGTRNFVDGGRSVYLRNSHGTNCLSLIGGELPGYYIGIAPRASFYLCITEDVGSEYPIEEANWLAAAEYADSVGVDVISSSLGYTTFDLTRLSHTYAELNGRTAIGSLAALGAARAGIVVLNSAGNDGTDSWHYISVPADADSIISVGATDSLRTHASFSSYGPTADGRIKPTLSCMGVASAVLNGSGQVLRGNGTSYSCPEMAGLAAAFWQANPTLTAQQVITALEQSATQAQNPDNVLGYGIPDFPTAYNLRHPGAALVPVGELAVYPNPSQTGQLMLALPLSLRSQPLRARIIDSRGATVADLPLTPDGAASVPLTIPRHLAPGVYQCVVQPTTDGPKQTARFVVQ